MNVPIRILVIPQPSAETALVITVVSVKRVTQETAKIVQILTNAASPKKFVITTVSIKWDRTPVPAERLTNY